MCNGILSQFAVIYYSLSKRCKLTNAFIFNKHFLTYSITCTLQYTTIWAKRFTQTQIWKMQVCVDWISNSLRICTRTLKHCGTSVTFLHLFEWNLLSLRQLLLYHIPYLCNVPETVLFKANSFQIFYFRNSKGIRKHTLEY